MATVWFSFLQLKDHFNFTVWWNNVQNFSRSFIDVVKSSRYIQGLLVFTGISLVFLSLHFGLVAGSVLIKACKAFLALTVLFGLLLVVWLVAYISWLSYMESNDKENSKDDELQMSLISSTDEQEPQAPSKGSLKSKKIRLKWTEFRFSYGDSREVRKQKVFLLLKHLGFIVMILFFAISSISIFAAYTYYWTHTLPQLNGAYRTNGIQYPQGVTIERDQQGMIHIKAQNEHDLMIAQGVAAAQDRLFQMEFMRRIGRGTLCEIVGSAALPIDKFSRTLGFYKAAQSAAKNITGSTLDMLNAYTQGINSYLEMAIALPLEFHLLGFTPAKFEVEDTLLWAKLMSLDLSMNLGLEALRYSLLKEQGISPDRIQELLPPYPTDAVTILSDQDLRHLNYNNFTYSVLSEQESLAIEMQRLRKEYSASSKSNTKRSSRSQAKKGCSEGTCSPFGSTVNIDLFMEKFFNDKKFRASNNWVVGGSKTATGKPFLANDPHLSLSVPSIWLLVHLQNTATGESMIGATFPGTPGVTIGRNNYIAWGVTNVGADVQDLYIIDEVGDGSHYWSNGQTLSYSIREEKIQIKDEDAVTINVKETVYGPVINDVYEEIPAGPPVALRWTALDPEDTTLLAFNGIMHARNFAEFREALRNFTVPSQNFIFADLEGNIGYQCPGHIPVRAAGHTGAYPVHSNDSFSWRGYIPFDELPWTYNPPEGFIVTANNKVPPASYPYTLLFSSDWEVKYRATRIRQMIEGKPQLTLQDMKDIQYDEMSLLFHDFKPILEKMQKPYPAWRDKLLEWDGYADVDSVHATVFQVWYMELSELAAKEVGRDHWSEPGYLLQAFLDGTDPNCVNYKPEGCIGYAKDALSRAVRQFDTIPKWGSLHQCSFQHPILQSTPIGCLYGRKVPHGGDPFTVNVANVKWDGSYDMDAGPSYRQIIDLDSPSKSLFVHPMGQSGDLFSPYFENLLWKWQRGDYLPMVTSGYTVDHTVVLIP